MMGGGEFIVNGAERVIVSQLHRSPGVDFSIISSEGDRPLHSTRIIPERGSWIELEVTKKDVLAMRIDQSTKLAATTFLRCLDESVAETSAILSLFYEISEVKAENVKPDHWAADTIVDTETGEELVHVGRQIGQEAASKIVNSSLKKVKVIENPSDVLILNTVAEEKLEQFEEQERRNTKRALLKLYTKLRPGNPPQVEKAKALFVEKFFDENRYRLGRVGRFRINRKFELETPEDLMFITPRGLPARDAVPAGPSQRPPGPQDGPSGRGRWTTSTTWETGACARWTSWRWRSSARASSSCAARCRSA